MGAAGGRERTRRTTREAKTRTGACCREDQQQPTEPASIVRQSPSGEIAKEGSSSNPDHHRAGEAPPAFAFRIIFVVDLRQEQNRGRKKGQRPYTTQNIA